MGDYATISKTNMFSCSQCKFALNFCLLWMQFLCVLFPFPADAPLGNWICSPVYVLSGYLSLCTFCPLRYYCYMLLLYKSISYTRGIFMFYHLFNFLVVNVLAFIYYCSDAHIARMPTSWDSIENVDSFHSFMLSLFFKI